MSFKISKGDWDKVINYSQYAWDSEKSEIGGYMIVQRDMKTGDFVMSDPVILEQVITAGNTVIDKDALAKYLMKTAMKHGTDIYYCWWHSHHTMSAFWSGTDLTAIQQSKHSDVSFSLVVNLAEEYKFRVSIWEPLEVHTDVEIEIMGAERTIPKYIKDNVDKLCSTPVVKINKSKKPSSFTYANYGNYYRANNQITMFPDDDDERTQLEAKLDNVLLDYIASNIVYDEYVTECNKINAKLEEDKSELRIGVISEDNIDSVVHLADADFYIHAAGVPFNEDEIIQQVMHLYQ